MRIRDLIIRKIPFLAQLNGLKNVKRTLSISKDIKKAFNEYQEKENEIIMTNEVKDIFKKSFINFIWAQSKDSEIAFSFLNSVIRPIKENIKIDKIQRNSPILICIVKDDLQRIEMSLKYYRQMGIKNFVYVDNMSTDGTFEYLLEQPDIDLYKCETPYTTQNREAWINRIIAHYGFNHWYLCVDSDELFVYDNMEEISIEGYISKLGKKNRRVRALLLDMYSKDAIFKDTENIQEYYCYFDCDTYTHKSTYKLEAVTGGPRQRVFFENSKKKFMLTKYPLFYFIKGDIQCGSHFQYPFSPNCGVPCTTALLHYKFLKSDLEKYMDRVKLGNYANGSEEYKKYIEVYNKGKNISLYNEKSIKYINSESLKKIKNIFKNEV